MEIIKWLLFSVASFKLLQAAALFGVYFAVRRLKRNLRPAPTPVERRGVIGRAADDTVCHTLVTEAPKVAEFTAKDVANIGRGQQYIVVGHLWSRPYRGLSQLLDRLIDGEEPEIDKLQAFINSLQGDPLQLDLWLKCIMHFFGATALVLALKKQAKADKADDSIAMPARMVQDSIDEDRNIFDIEDDEAM